VASARLLSPQAAAFLLSPPDGAAAARRAAPSFPRTARFFAHTPCLSTPTPTQRPAVSAPSRATAPPAGRRGLHVVAARVAGVEIPNAKRIEFSLQYIYGVGPTTAKAILADTVR
jgi:hypothetical protein